MTKSGTVLAGIILSICAVAHADVTTESDGFEGSTPWTRWQGFAQGTGVAWFDVNKNLGDSASPKNNGWLQIQNGWGWAAERIPFTMQNYRSAKNCAARVKVQAVNVSAQVGLQVWNPNNWTILQDNYPWIVADGKYHDIVVELGNNPFSGTVYLQVIYGATTPNFVRVDEMELACSGY